MRGVGTRGRQRFGPVALARCAQLPEEADDDLSLLRRQRGHGTKAAGVLAADRGLGYQLIVATGALDVTLSVTVLVVPTNEELEIARQTLQVALHERPAPED